MTARLAFLMVALLSSGAQAQVQSPKAPARQANVGTWAELQERSWIEDVRGAINGASQNGSAAERAVGQRFGQCVAANAPDEARVVVLEMMSQADVKRRFPRIFRLQCSADKRPHVAKASLEIPSPMLQLWLADALVRREYGVSGPGDLSAVSAPAKLAAGLTDANWTVLKKLGECIARHSPEQVRLLARTDAATPEERAAIAVLAPTMGLCLPPGATIRLRTNDVRGSALLNYYQLAQASGAAHGKVR